MMAVLHIHTENHNTLLKFYTNLYTLKCTNLYNVWIPQKMYKFAQTYTFIFSLKLFDFLHLKFFPLKFATNLAIFGALISQKEG